MNNTPYHIFINFVEFDQKLEQKKKLLLKKQEELDALTAQKAQSVEKQEQARHQVHDLKKQVDRLELDLKVLREREKTKKKQLDQVSSTKEYMSLEHELATLTTQYKKVDDELFEIWQQYEQSQSAFEEHVPVYTQTLDALQQDLDKSAREVAQLIEDIEVLEVERDALRKQVHAEWLPQYDSMKERVSNPVVTVENNVCTGCFLPVASHDISALRRHKLLACRECFRLLYLND